MISKVVLILFGWRRVPDHFAQRIADYIPMYLRERRVKSHVLKKDCLVALAGCAFESAKNGRQENPRLVHLVREVERLCDAIAFVRNVEEIGDARVRSILVWHGVELPIDATAYSAR
jgi:hypothetical protein